MGFSDLVVVHNGGFLLRNHLAFAMKENDGADRLALAARPKFAANSRHPTFRRLLNQALRLKFKESLFVRLPALI